MIVNLTPDGWINVTKSDTVNDPDGPFVALFVWKAGTVAAVDAAGNATGTSDSLAAGTYIPGKFVRVKSTGTTATVLGALGVA